MFINSKIKFLPEKYLSKRDYSPIIKDFLHATCLYLHFEQQTRPNRKHQMGKNILKLLSAKFA